MPIMAQKPQQINFNVAYIPQIIISSRIDPATQSIVSSVLITLKGASLSADGKWVDGGPDNRIQIQDLNKLPDDLQKFGQVINDVFGQLVEIINDVNVQRKLV